MVVENEDYDDELLKAYGDGIDAAYRIGKYEGIKSVPKCPYPKNTTEYKAWLDGFGDGTEDFIQAIREGLL